jgi:leucine dehydrogenase
MWTYDDTRLAVRDALRLSRAMTFKSACAGLPLGGGKGVVMLPAGSTPPTGAARRDLLLDFGETVDALHGAYVTAEDVGTSSADMTTIAEVTRHVSGLDRDLGGSGDPSPWTALGCHVAIEAACERVFGTRDLHGRTVAVVGLGNVGLRLAELLAAAGARLVVADIRAERHADAERLGATWTTPADALTADVDVLAPCALGGVLDAATIPQLRCRVICGAANNQLAEDAGAAQLAARGIVWVPDFVANAGGIANIAVEQEPGGYAVDVAERVVRGIADTVGTLLDEAQATGATPLAAAESLARQRLQATA